MVWHREFWVQRDLQGKSDPKCHFGAFGVDFCHCSVHWIYVITSNLQRAPGQVAQSSGPVQAPSKCLGALIVGKTIICIIGRFSSCLLKLMRHAPL